MRHCVLLFLSLCVVGLQGCSYLRMQQAVRASPTDWIMYGGSIGRTNHSYETLKPPFVKVWEYDASAGFSPYSGAASDGYLFVGNLQGEVHAIEISTGKKIGVHDFGSSIVGTPIIENNTLFVALTNEKENLVGYNLLTGRVVWRAVVGNVESSPLMIGDRLYVTTLQGKLICVNKHTGETIWTYKIPVQQRPTIIRSSPSSDGNIILFGCDDGHLYAVDGNDGTFRWSAKTGGSIVSSPSIRARKVVVGSLDEILYAFDVDNGNLVWKQALGAKIYASPAINEKHVYIGTSAQTFYCISLETGNVIWKFSTKSVINAPPLISGDIVYVGSLDKNLYALHSETGDLLWQYQAKGRIKTMPIISKQRLIVFVEDRSVIAFKNVESE
ncbi:MAG: PQQ-like beta-propeller repeat protein [Ignavibacteriae bacterium]|nr:PQQ-like beta-propeller repeat protein [Ignavibacteriota bacterium]